MKHVNAARRALLLLAALTLTLAPLSALCEGGASATVPPVISLEDNDAEELVPVEDVPAAEDAAPTPGADPVDDAEADDQIKYVATAKTALKLRRTAERINNGIGSIKRGETVYLIDYGVEWSRVQTSRSVGFVLSDFLENVRAYNPGTEEVGEAVEAPVFDTAATEDGNGFANNFQALSVTSTRLYKEPNYESYNSSVPIYRKVIVSENSGGWSYCKFDDHYGYIPTADLYQWDRLNAYAGDIPGLIVYPKLAFINKSANVYAMQDNKALNSYPVNAGSAIAVHALDEQGRYPTMFYREDAYLNAEDVAGVIDVVPWADAQPGDLISVMTTFYSVGVSTLNYQGRNWNIYLAGSKISGTVLEPGDAYDQNKTIGPYSKSTGYKSAPIMSPTKLTGYGGGTCQVNTTFYITTMQVPLLVTHRRVHCNVGMYYCMKGFDAAVGGGNINLQMVNTLPYAIRYQYFISDGVMTCCIFRDH